MSELPITLLKPHPKNSELFPDRLPENLWRELVEDIRQNGIINPLVVAPDYTVLAGHLRLEAAKEAGLTHIPVVIRDVDPESDEAVSMLIRDNLLRRHLNDVQIARLIRKLKEEYGIRHGGDRRSQEARESRGQNVLLKIADMMGLNERHIKRLDKINDLIPDFKSLLESGKWSATTVASIIGSLPPEEQQQLLEMLGESGVCALSVKEAQELKRELDSIRKEKESLLEQLAELEEERNALSRQLADLQDSLVTKEEEIAERLSYQYEEKLRAAVIDLQRKLERAQEETEELRTRLRELKSKPEKVIEKIVYRTDPALEAELEAARKQSAELIRENEHLRVRFEEIAKEKEKKEAKLREVEAKYAELERRQENLKKELSREKQRPKPDVRRIEALELMGRANKSAVELSEALKALMDRYFDYVLAFVYERDAQELEGAVQILEGAFSVKMLDISLHAVADRLTKFFSRLEKERPHLKLIKGGVKDDKTEAPVAGRDSSGTP
ncbi:MAG: ParB N-terminal domain-containing protein [Thermacetogeniaceae bacterium]